MRPGFKLLIGAASQHTFSSLHYFPPRGPDTYRGTAGHFLNTYSWPETKVKHIEIVGAPQGRLCQGTKITSEEMRSMLGLSWLHQVESMDLLAADLEKGCGYELGNHVAESDCRLKRLSFHSNFVDEREMVLLLRALHKNTSLKSLEMRSWNMERRVWSLQEEELLRSLVSNTQIERLALFNNRFMARDALVEAAKENPSLVLLLEEHHARM